jgi:predicted nucleic acid-binding protein
LGLVHLDSSVLIAILNSEDKHHRIALENYSSLDQYQISTISITEVMPSALKAGTAPRILEILRSLTRAIIDLDAEIALLAAKLRVEAGLKTPDAIISATASRHQAQLWTFDGKLAKAHKGARLLA